MEKNCIHCGAALDDDARFCGSCGQPRGTVEAGAVQPEPQAALQPEADARPMSAARPAKEPKKSRRKLLLIGGIAAGAAVLAAVFFLFILPSITGGASGQEMIVFSEGGSNYYVSPYLFMLNGDGDPSLVRCTYPDGSESHSAFIPPRAARDGNTFYDCRTLSASGNGIYRYTIVGSNQITVSECLGESDFADCIFARMTENWFRSFRQFAFDDGCLYFNIVPSVDLRLTQGAVTYKMGKISLSSKEITALEGVSAGDFLIHDGWIYYIDEGFVYDESTGPDGSIDRDRTGVYKVRTDGSDKALIRALSYDADANIEPEWKIADELCLVDGKLYYLDYSAEGRGRVCRMSLSGGDVEYVSTKEAYRYAVDTDHGALYYTVADGGSDQGVPRGDGAQPKLRRFDFASGSDEELPYAGFSSNDLAYFDGYLYFANYSSFRYSTGVGEQPDSVCGLRMNVDTGRFQKLIGYNDSQTLRTIDPNTGRRVMTMTDGEDHLYWEEVEPRSAGD